MSRKHARLRDDGNREIVLLVRDLAAEVTGGNCTFADDDVRVLAGLARRAIEAGLTDDLHPSVRDSLDRKHRRGKYA